MEKRDAILAKLALSLGLIDDVGLQRAMQLMSAEPGASIDRLMFKAGLIDAAGHQKLALAFNQRVRDARQRTATRRHQRLAKDDDLGAAAADKGMGPARPPIRAQTPGLRRPAGGLGRSAPPIHSGAGDDELSLRQPGATIRNEDSAVIHVAEQGPFPSSGSYKPDDLVVSSDMSLNESSDDVIVPVHMESSDELTLPADDDLAIPDDADDDELSIPDDDEAVFAEPTVMLQDASEPEEPTEVLLDSDNDDAVFAEPTVVLQDGGDDPQPMLSISPAEEDGILSEPTVVLQDGDGGQPSMEISPAPGEDGIYAEPTVVIEADSELSVPDLAGEADDGIYAEPTMILSEDPTAHVTGRKRLEESSGELEIDISLAKSGRAPQSKSSKRTPGVRSQEGSGPLSSEEFETRLKRRQGFKGFTVGDYKILGELARGAFGVVLEVEPGGVAKQLAKERGYQGNLALKVMMTNTADPRQSDRFLDEVRVLISFDHPHIVKIFDAGVENGLTYYSMELVRGVETRSHVIKNGPMPALLAVRVVKEIASALSYVHAQQIYHRDLKPQNIMLDTSFQPYRTLLIDFGLVTEAESSEDKGLIMGTPSYMPPEQAQPRGDHGEINSTSDIYSLGASMFFLMTGKPPFAGRDPRKIIKQVVSEAAPDPCELNPQIPRRIADICLKCLAKKQRDRYHSSRLLEQDLDKELRSGRMKLKAKAILGRFLGRKKP